MLDGKLPESKESQERARIRRKITKKGAFGPPFPLVLGFCIITEAADRVERSGMERGGKMLLPWRRAGAGLDGRSPESQQRAGVRARAVWLWGDESTLSPVKIRNVWSWLGW